MLYGRLVQVGETFYRIADYGLRIAQKCVWRPGSGCESYSAPPDSLAVMREGGKGRERVGNTEGRKGR